MKLRLDIFPMYGEKEIVKIPLGYRSNVISLIKEAFRIGEKGEEFFNKNYEENTLKPFTFSVYFPNLQKSKERFFDFNNEYFTVNFSTNNFNYLSRLYEGIRGFNNFTPFSFPVKYKLTLLPDREVFKESMIYKTMSPIVVRSFDSNTKKTNGYIGVNEKGYTHNLIEAVRYYNNRIEGLPDSLIDTIEVIPLATKETKIFFKNHLIPCTNGKFKILAHPLVQKMIYNVGLGSRRSEGFGMLEVIECIE